MKFLEKIKTNPAEGVTVAFLGDSITEGCFELYKTENGGTESVKDPENGYAACFIRALKYLFPTVPVRAVNAGIAGDNARGGAKRVETDVVRHKPDLTVVCYGLNDCGDKVIYAERYVNALAEIFDRLREVGSDVIFMTPNMMNTELGTHLLDDENLLMYAKSTMQRQNAGLFDAHIERARETCRMKNVPVCDCYAFWKALDANGVNVTDLLCNAVNHPSREMHKLFAAELLKTLFAS